MTVGGARSEVQQIAVAPTGSPGGTGGDIYVANAATQVPGIEVYSEAGILLGHFGFNAPDTSNNIVGVATNSSGHIFTILYDGTVTEYVPTANPPVDSDLTASGGAVFGTGGQRLTVDDAGNIYSTKSVSEGSTLFKFAGVSDRHPTPVGPGALTTTVDPGSGTLFADEREQVTEYGPGGSPPLGVFGATEISESQGIGFEPAKDEVYVPDKASGRVKIFGPPVTVPTVSAGSPTSQKPPEVTLRGSVNPEGLTVTKCVFEYGLTSEYGQEQACAELPLSGTITSTVSATLTGLRTDGTLYHFRLVAANANGTERSPDQTFETSSTVRTEPATDVSETTAVLHGLVFPNELNYEDCEFEVGPVSSEGFESKAPCDPAAGLIPADSSFHPVAAELEHLSPKDVTYRFRLRAKTTEGEPIIGKTLRFTTSGDPSISEVRAVNATQSSAELEATIDPHGFATTYQIEWGAEGSIGQIAGSGSILASGGPTRVSAVIGGLVSGTLYDYRITTENASGKVASLNRQVESLDSCGLPQQRCFELVSPSESGPTASPGHVIEFLEFETNFQPAERGGALDYVSEGGYPGATRGGEVLYQATRSSTGWSTVQMSPSVSSPDETTGEHSNPGRTLAVSPELSCSVVETNQRLPETTRSMLQVLEAGGENLYRRDADGTYTPLTLSPPDNIRLPAQNGNKYFYIAGMSPNCDRIYFQSVYNYPRTRAVTRPGGPNGPAEYGLYEWSDSRLRSVGLVPSPTGEVAVPAMPGATTAPETGVAARNAVTRDGARIFFTAPRHESANPEELGAPGLFMRAGTVVRDVSLSETSVPDVDPRYQWATPDGLRVYFTAPGGLTDESSPGGTDLYEYDLSKSPSEHPLRDLTVNLVEPTAKVAGMVGASEDGSRIYFAATGRLIAGEGLSAAENEAEGTWSLYLLDEGHLRFVATVSASVNGHSESNILLGNSASDTAEVSEDGRFLLFESTRPATTYESDGAREAYLFDALVGSEPLTCISCRSDGRPPSARADSFRLLIEPAKMNKEGYPVPRSMTLAQGVPSVIFSSLDPLAAGAIEGDMGLYQWSHGQVFLIREEPQGLQQLTDSAGKPVPPGSSRSLFALGSNADGSDIYFATPEALTWDDTDGRSSVYDARIGGGFGPSPSIEMEPCDPTVEASCQGSSSPAPTPPKPASPSFVGPANPKARRCKKGQVEKHDKCTKAPKAKKKRKSAKRGHGKKRSAGGNHKRKHPTGKAPTEGNGGAGK
jgi:hypothetical protein